MDVKDPQNPVHFALDSTIPTEMDPTKENYGLAQLIADGPSTQDFGVLNEVALGPAPTAPVVSVNPRSNLGAPSPAGPNNVPQIVYVGSGVQQLGKGP